MDAMMQTREERVTIELLAQETAAELEWVEEGSAVVEAGRRLDRAAAALESVPEGYRIMREQQPSLRRSVFCVYGPRGGLLLGMAIRKTWPERGAAVSTTPATNLTPEGAAAFAAAVTLAAIDADGRA